VLLYSSPRFPGRFKMNRSQIQEVIKQDVS
jgi:hypothetical protein